MFPTLFVSHGSPMTALHPKQVGDVWRTLGEHLHPQAIIILSAHWQTQDVEVGAVLTPSTIYDFNGFPQALYHLQYPAPGNPALAQNIVDLLTAAKIAARCNPSRGLDHGVWVPLLHMFPKATIPVVTISLPYSASPKDVWKMGKALTSLRNTCLIIGSGSITHNLGDWGKYTQETPAPYVQPFISWVVTALENRSEDLFEYHKAPGAAQAHPTTEHFLPLFFAWGASTGKMTHRPAEIDLGFLAMDVFEFE